MKNLPMPKKIRDNKTVNINVKHEVNAGEDKKMLSILRFPTPFSKQPASLPFKPAKNFHQKQLFKCLKRRRDRMLFQPWRKFFREM